MWIVKFMLTRCSFSDKRGTSLGVFFRGRTFSGKKDACIYCSIFNGKAQKVGWQARAGQYHELLWEEIRGKTGGNGFIEARDKI